VRPHGVRHYFAHALKEAGATAEDTMTLGGWCDPQIMRHYDASMAQARARETHRRLSPGDRL
jgi:integrase